MAHVGWGWGGRGCFGSGTGRGEPDLGGPPQSPRARTHQRDPGPRPRRGAVEGRARGGRWPSEQQRPQTGHRRERRGGCHQPGCQEGPDRRHGRAGTAGSEGHNAEETRAGTRSVAPAQSPNFAFARAAVGGAAPAQSPGSAAAQPEGSGAFGPGPPRSRGRPALDPRLSPSTLAGLLQPRPAPPAPAGSGRAPGRCEIARVSSPLKAIPEQRRSALRRGAAGSCCLRRGPNAAPARGSFSLPPRGLSLCAPSTACAHAPCKPQAPRRRPSR